MELLAPSYGLIAFQAFILISIVLVAAAWVVIALNRKIDSASKLVWLLITLCAPIIGPIFLFIYTSSLARQTRSRRY